jgi:hypothetical protein
MKEIKIDNWVWAEFKPSAGRVIRKDPRILQRG